MSSFGTLTLKVLSPEGIIFEEEKLNGVDIPLADGCPIGIRPGHAPLIAETEQGIIRLRSTESENEINLHAGVLDIRDNLIILLTAGEIENTHESIDEPITTEYDRLMQTLIQQLQPENRTEQETQ